MSEPTSLAVQALLDREPVLTAAVVVEGEPVAAVLPFAVTADGGALLVHVSALARHARGLFDGAPVGIAVHAAASAGRDPMQLPRLTVQTVAHAVERGSPAFDAAAARLAARFPAAATTLALPDFSVYALALGRGRYVEGFARAVSVGPATFARA